MPEDMEDILGATGTVAPLQADPGGVKVRLAAPLVQAIVSVSVPVEHVCVSVAPLPATVMARGEVNTKFPPVEADMLTTIFPVFTVSKSATDPAKAVRLMAGDVRANVLLEVKFTWAARAAPERQT
jgi:hypothetical protein